jgi:hypothetical protein
LGHTIRPIENYRFLEYIKITYGNIVKICNLKDIMGVKGNTDITDIIEKDRLH